LNNYFPTKDFSYLKICEPSFLPTQVPDEPFYEIEKIKKVSEIFYFENMHNIITEQFQHLLNQIIPTESFKKMKCIKLSEFWTLQLRNSNINWGSDIKRIESVISIPIGSSSCERGFSIMNYVKNKRSNLVLKNLENLVRVKINGPKSLPEFDAPYYALEWSKSHFRTDDERKTRGKIERIFHSYF